MQIMAKGRGEMEEIARLMAVDGLGRSTEANQNDRPQSVEKARTCTQRSELRTFDNVAGTTSHWRDD